MSDPKKFFKCLECGFVMNDKQRIMGKSTVCPKCLEIGLLKASERAEKTVERLRKARKIDPETLDRPITI